LYSTFRDAIILSVLNKFATFLLLSAFFLLIFVALVVFRSSDNNSLFSWAWVFTRTNASVVYLLLTAGLILSFVLARTELPTRYQLPFLALLSFAAAVPFWGQPETIVDASRYFTQAKHLEVYGIGFFLKEWGRNLQAWTDMPIVPLLFGILFKMFGEHRLAVQVFTTVLFSLTTVLTCLIGERLWNRETGFSAGLLLLGIPYLLTQVPLMLVDVPTMFFLMLAIFTFLAALDRGGPVRALCSVTTIVLVVLSKYSAWFMLSVLVIALIVRARQWTRTGDRLPLKRGLAILLTAGVVAGAVLLLKYDVVREQITLLREFQQPGLARWHESFLSTFLFQTHPVITAAAFASVVVAFRKRDATYLIIGWLILLPILFHITRIRYILPLFPMLALMAGYGLQAIPRADLRRSIVFATVATSLVIAFTAYLPFARSMSAVNLKHAGEYLDTLPGMDIEVVTVAPEEPVVNPAVSVPLLDLFTHKRIGYHYVDGSLLPREEILRSSLRFTWEYRNPAYYASSPDPAVAIPIVVLSDASDSSFPAGLAGRLKGYHISRSFMINEDVFKYTVGVRIYQPIESRSAR
jgi:4-amino-4-deoxy-L-arabinose transferase-like glycosyltransferase